VTSKGGRWKRKSCSESAVRLKAGQFRNIRGKKVKVDQGLVIGGGICIPVGLTSGIPMRNATAHLYFQLERKGGQWGEGGGKKSEGKLHGVLGKGLFRGRRRE